MTSAPVVANMLSLTAIRVSDLDRSVDFYTAGCGFVRGAEFGTPEYEVVVVRAGAAGIELMAGRDGQQFAEADHGNMFVKVVVNTTDTSAQVEQAVAHGGTVELPVTVLEQYGGMVIAMVRDPDGYLIEFTQKPRADQDH